MRYKKTVALCLALAGLLSTGATLAVHAQEITGTSVNRAVIPREAVEKTTCTLSRNESWRSGKYYCTSGEFGAYAGLKKTGKVSLKIFYHGTNNGSRSLVASGTVSSGYEDIFYDVGRAGYYSVEVTNIGSSSLTLDCGVIR